MQETCVGALSAWGPLLGKHTPNCVVVVGNKVDLAADGGASVDSAATLWTLDNAGEYVATNALAPHDGASPRVLWLDNRCLQAGCMADTFVPSCGGV